MNSTEFDERYQEKYTELLGSGQYMEAIEFLKEVILKESPDEELRVELLAGIAMAQVGIATNFTEALQAQGIKIREEVGMTPEEARRVAELVGTCLKLKADGMEQVSFPKED